MFDGVITDGVFPTVGDVFKVTSNESGMQVKVGTGRAWFDGFWARSDTATILDVDPSPTVVNYSRIDSVVLHISKANRKSTIEIISGTAGTNPVSYMPASTDDEKYYRLATIRVKYGVTSIANADISMTIGSSNSGSAPFVAGVTRTVDSLISLWNQQFNNWFDSMKNQLDSDAAGHLQNEINDIKTSFLSLTSAESQTVNGDVIFQNKLTANGLLIISSGSYGTVLPTTNLIEGRLFFKEAES